MRMWLGIVGIVVLLTAVLPPAWAQPPEPGVPRPEGPPPMGEPGRERDIRGLVESVMAARLAEELGLNDEQTVLMVRRFSEFKKEMNERKRHRAELLRELKLALQQGKPAPEIEERLDMLFRHDRESFEFKRSIYDRACEGLSLVQRAKMYVFLNQFEADMRQLIEKARERRAERFHRGDFFSPGPERGAPPPEEPARLRPGRRGAPPAMEKPMAGQRMQRRQGVSPEGPPHPERGRPPERPAP